MNDVLSRENSGNDDAMSDHNAKGDIILSSRSAKWVTDFAKNTHDTMRFSET